MFGEVFDTTKNFTSHFTTTDRMQAVLDFPFQDAARNFASRSVATDQLQTFFEDDDWYTDADSNVYQLPTFLGNHDMGRIGNFVVADNPGAGDTEWVARDRLAHELMYFSRGNPVIYYGDEQGFTGTGGDQVARQTMFASQVPDYLDDDLLGTTDTHAQDNFEPGHPLYRSIADLAKLTQEHDALRDGAQQHRLSRPGAGVYAFSRIDRREQREYVVALNNSETAQTASVETWTERDRFKRLYGDGPRSLKSDRSGRLTLTVPALSAVVYKLDGRIEKSRRAPSLSLRAPAPAERSRGRMQVRADVFGDSFYEVTFQASTGRGWRSIGTDDNAPYRVFHDVSGLRAGKDVRYRAIVLDNRGNKRTSASRTAAVPAPLVTIEAPAEGARVRGTVEVRAIADPERATHAVTFERSVAGGPWTTIGTDTSSPAYTVFDDLAPLNLATGTQIRYRAILNEPDGTTSTSAVRTIQQGPPPIATAVLHYFRPAGDYADWGLHMWGDAVADSVARADHLGHAVAAHERRPGDRLGALRDPAEDDTKPVNFIMHRPGGDSVPTTREPGGDRSFIPLDDEEVWIRQGDPTVYRDQPETG